MSTTLTRRLPELAAAINREHELCEGSYRTALEHALRAGALLSEAKAQVDHGHWLTWVADHTTISTRVAQQYMQLAGADAKSISHLGIADALHDVAEPAAQPPAADLRTTLRTVERADAEAALAELGEMPESSAFPSSAMERTTWRQVREELGRVARSMDEASADGLSKWSRREALREGARRARDAGALLSELADTLAV